MTSSTPENPNASVLAWQVLGAFKNGEKHASPVIQSLMGMGVLGVDSPVYSTNSTLMDAMIRQVLDARGIHACQAEDLMGSRNLKQWVEAAGEDVFTRRTREGKWVPLAWMDKILSLGNNGVGAPWTTKRLDDWFSFTLSRLDLTKDEARKALVGALTLDLPQTSNLIWKRFPPRNDPSIAAVLTHARSGWAWESFLAKGGDPHQPVDGKPLWRSLVPSKPSTMASASTLAGKVERWAWAYLAQGKGSEEDYEWVEENARRRAQAGRRGQRGLDAGEWVEQLSATRFPGPTWSNEKNEPVWVLVARKSFDPRFLPSLMDSPLRARVDPARVAVEQANLLTRHLARANARDEPVALREWEEVFDGPDWSEHNHPPVLALALKKTRPDSHLCLIRLANKHPDRWFGPDPNTECLLCDQALNLLCDPTSGSADPQEFVVFDELTSSRHGQPGVDLARAFVRAATKNDSAALELIQPHRHWLAPSSEEGTKRYAQLERWAARRVRGKRREAWGVLLDSLKLEASLEAAKPGRPRAARF